MYTLLLDHPMIDRSTIHKINIVRDYYPCRRENRFSVPIDQHNARSYCILLQYYTTQCRNVT